MSFGVSDLEQMGFILYDGECCIDVCEKTAIIILEDDLNE